MNPLQRQPSGTSGCFHRIFQSIFSEPIIPKSAQERGRYLLKNLILHFRPTAVPEKTLKFSLTWGLGGMAAVLVFLQLGTGLLLKFVYVPTPSAMNQPEEAIQNYWAAITIDDMFYPAKVNFAMLYNRRDENDGAELLLREVITTNPGLYEIAYSLGLLLAEMKKCDLTAVYLKKATKGMPKRSRVHLQPRVAVAVFTKRCGSRRSIAKGIENRTLQYGLSVCYGGFLFKKRKITKSQIIAEKMVAKHPDNRVGHALMDHIERIRKR